MQRILSLVMFLDREEENDRCSSQPTDLGHAVQTTELLPTGLSAAALSQQLLDGLLGPS